MRGKDFEPERDLLRRMGREAEDKNKDWNGALVAVAGIEEGKYEGRAGSGGGGGGRCVCGGGGGSGGGVWEGRCRELISP